MDHTSSMRLAAIVLCTLWSVVQSEFIKDFMGASCGEQLQPRVSGRLETSQSLTYDNQMDCDVTIAVDAGKRILLFMKRFEVEGKAAGTCLDYLTIHDGASTTATQLTSEPLCGTIQDQFNLTTSSNHVTFHFISDATAVYRGFAFEYTEFTLAPCDTTQFECDNEICININNVCDDVTQCGDGSDEAHCSIEEILASQRGDLPLIIGCSVAGLILLIIIIVVIYKVYQYYRWRRFIRINDELSVDDLYQYPVTDLYNKHDIGRKGRRPPDVKSYYRTPTMATPYHDNDHYIDEM